MSRPLVAVLALALLLCGALALWALAGPLFGDRPPVGDGRDPASYGFDLSRADLRGGAIATSGYPRDFLVPLDDPQTIAGVAMAEHNRRRRGKELVTTDRVVGVFVGDEARAYPVTLLNAHEVVNDTLGGVPIAVTFSPLADAPTVVDRRMNGRTALFGVSGLLLDSALLIYDRDEPGGSRSLFAPLHGRAVAGPALDAAAPLTIVPAVQLVTWREWLLMHPRTTVALRDPASARRYRQFSYRRYLDRASPVMPVGRSPSPGPIGPMDPVVLLRRGDDRVAWSIPALLDAVGSGGRLTERLGESTVHLTPDAHSRTVRVDAPPDTFIVRGLWFALYAVDRDLAPLTSPDRTTETTVSRSKDVR